VWSWSQVGLSGQHRDSYCLFGGLSHQDTAPRALLLGAGQAGPPQDIEGYRIEESLNHDFIRSTHPKSVARSRCTHVGDVRRQSIPPDSLFGIRDAATRLRLARRLDKAARGLSGDVKSVGGRVFEMREDFGPGWRMYL